MKKANISRRKFIYSTTMSAASSAAFGINPLVEEILANGKPVKKEVVSIVRISNGNIHRAVHEAIDLLGGVESVLGVAHKIMLKPNLVSDSRHCTTKVEVVKALARIMQKSGKEVSIGEGSAAAASFNVIDNETFRTRKRIILDKMQEHVFDVLGYSEMAESLKIPLVNLHSGDMVDILLNNGLAAKSVKVHKAVAETDLVCSVPMMKTHVLATVTLAMKNLIGLYPGTEYYSVRSWLHDAAYKTGSPGVAYEVMDINQSVRTGLSVIDASMAMEGNGPSEGNLVEMGLIVAGTSPLATDIAGAALMGFSTDEVPVLKLSNQLGKMPQTLADIEVRGLKIEDCSRRFAKPEIYKWSDINMFWGVKEL